MPRPRIKTSVASNASSFFSSRRTGDAHGEKEKEKEKEEEEKRRRRRRRARTRGREKERRRKRRRQTRRRGREGKGNGERRRRRRRRRRRKRRRKEKEEEEEEAEKKKEKESNISRPRGRLSGGQILRFGRPPDSVGVPNIRMINSGGFGGPEGSGGISGRFGGVVQGPSESFNSRSFGQTF